MMIICRYFNGSSVVNMSEFSWPAKARSDAQTGTLRQVRQRNANLNCFGLILPGADHELTDIGLLPHVTSKNGNGFEHLEVDNGAVTPTQKYRRSQKGSHQQARAQSCMSSGNGKRLGLWSLHDMRLPHNSTCVPVTRGY